MQHNNSLLDAILRQDFTSFINKVFNTINPATAFEPNWHIELIAEYLEEVRKGSIKRLIINIPPRSLKSVCVSVALPAWLLAHNPASRIIAASYSQTLSIKHSLDCKFVITSDWYKKLFPATILSKSHNQKSKFLTTENGFRFASSVLGSITGEGGDFLIIDDPHNPIHINSPKRREKVIEWFEQTFIPRLNDKNNGRIILVMQRLHSEDLSGYLIAHNSYWQHLKIPIIANKSLTFALNDTEHELQEGELLHQARDNAEGLDKLAAEIGRANYAAQYLQEPQDDSSSLLKYEDITFYNTSPEKYDYYVQSWDTAIKVNENSDYSVCLSFGISQDKFYLIHAFREKLPYPHLKQQLYSLNNKFLPKFILIEDKASGQQLIQDLKLEGFNNTIPCKPKLDKITRFASVVPYFQSGRIALSKTGSLNKIIIAELTSFPYSQNDDIVDSMSQFLNFMKDRSYAGLPRIRNL